MFEHSLIGLEQRKKSRRGWFSLPVAILIHLVALATFAFAGYWEVGRVPEPAQNVVFYQLASPPPPPPPPLGGGQQPKEQTPAAKPPEVKPEVKQQTVQPEDVSDELPPAIKDVVGPVADVPGDPRGSEKGVIGGDPDFGVDHSDGPPGPAVPTLIAPADPEPVKQGPIVVGGEVKKPEPIYQPQPRYTETARKARVQGTVVLRAVIDEHGNVTDLKVLRGQPMGLDQAALDAVRMWRFKPATLHGQPVKVYFTLTVNFQLN
jgi:protein TonB